MNVPNNELQNSLNLGAILCRKCGKLIGELDTERVAKFYLECSDPECVDTQEDEAV